MRRTLFSAAFAVAAGFLAAGCQSNHIPPFPTDVDPCASYCLVWVPPVYRDAPKLVTEKCGSYVPTTVCYDKTRFCEVERPAIYTPRCVPDECRAYGIVEATPARDEWQRVKCTDGCCNQPNCFKQVHVPATYTWCEKTETERGFEYCAFTPPERHVVATTERCSERVAKYCPPEYRIDYVPELYSPGHYEWQARYCEEPKTCARSVCAPCTSCAKRRPGFDRCPSQD